MQLGSKRRNEEQFEIEEKSNEKEVLVHFDAFEIENSFTSFLKANPK